MIEKISVVRRGELYVAMGGPKQGGGDKNEVFSVSSYNESILRQMAMEEAQRRGIKKVIGLNVEA